MRSSRISQRRLLSAPNQSILRSVPFLLLAAATSSCASFDEDPGKIPAGTFGQDVFASLCDRLGAEVLQEDLSGGSYRALCHGDANGVYATTVDSKVADLPAPVSEKAKAARVQAIAKMERMAAWREKLVTTIDEVFPDVSIENVDTPTEDYVRLLDGAQLLAQRITPLYDSNIEQPGAVPPLPASTRAAARVTKAISTNAEAVQTLSSVWGRRGYRPAGYESGALRAVVAYPELRKLGQSALTLFRPGAAAYDEFQSLLRQQQGALRNFSADEASMPELSGDRTLGQLNRPRTSLEIASALLLDESDAYRSDRQAAAYIAKRDRRGWAVPKGNQPGVPGTVPQPFADTNEDGYADVDGFGRFLDANGQVLGIDTPFQIPGDKKFAVDGAGRSKSELFEYVDVTRTGLNAVMELVSPLFNGNQYAVAGDAEPWLREYEALMYQGAGLYVLLGDREEAVWDYKNDRYLPAGTACEGCLTYKRFKAADGPMPDLAHAMGQMLADKDSDTVLLALRELIEKHEGTVARLIKAALRVDEIAEIHDQLADAGEEHRAEIPYAVPLWDEVAEVVNRMTEQPGLMARLVESLADPRNVETHGTSKHAGQTFGAFMRFRDQMNYNPQNINGIARNLSLGNNSFADPAVEIAKNAPRTGENRSIWERTLNLIYDAAYVKGCNKQGAKVYQNLFDSIEIYYPPTGAGYNECDLFEFEDLSVLFFHSLLGKGHPKKAKFNIKGEILGGLIAQAQGLGALGGVTVDYLFENSSGLTGLTLTPTPAALMRLMFFGTSSEAFPLPDVDTVNANSKTAKFVGGTLNPIGTFVCKPNSSGVPHCNEMKDLFRVRDGNTIFAWERLGFLSYITPMVEAFVNQSCNASKTQCEGTIYSERLFLDLLRVAWRHWPGPDHGDYCDGSGSASTNVRFCSGAGINRYEPIMADALDEDLFPALNEFANVAKAMRIKRVRGPEAGTIVKGPDLLERLTYQTFSTAYASENGLRNYAGDAETRWTDGTVQKQTTLFTLMADALHKIDTRFDTACNCGGSAGNLDCSAGQEACLLDAKARRSMWKRARSLLVDELLQIEGEGSAARFKNRAIPALLLKGVDVLRQQLNTRCPEREAGEDCVWARDELGSWAEQQISGPTVAAAVDLLDAVRADEPARRNLGNFLNYLLRHEDNGGRVDLLMTGVDALQLMRNDVLVQPLMQALEGAAAPTDAKGQPGMADAGLAVLRGILDKGQNYDPHHVLEIILPRLTEPVDAVGGAIPITVFADAYLDVNRLDASAVGTPMSRADYQQVMSSLLTTLADKTRGVEQFYTILQKRGVPEN